MQIAEKSGLLEFKLSWFVNKLQKYPVYVQEHTISNVFDFMAAWCQQLSHRIKP